MAENPDDRDRDNLTALPLVAPFVIVYAALFLYPTAQMLAMSLTNAGLIKPGDFIWFDNYIELFTDRRFGTSLLNTLWFVLMTVVPGTAVGLGLALLVNRLHGWTQRVVLAVFFIPYILPVSTVAAIGWWIADVDGGGLQPLLELLNGRPVPVWRLLPWFMPAVAVMTIWWTAGFNVLLFLAALRAVPHEVYEAAKLDSAGRWRQFWRITWPLIWPVTALVLTVQLILQLKVFDQVYLMVGGGRVDATMVLVQYVYTLAFARNQGGYAATVAVALFVIVALVAGVLQWQLRRARSAT